MGKKARQIVRLLLEEHFPSHLNQVATDYRSTMVSCVELLKQDEEHFDVRYKDENDEDYPEGPKLKVFKITCVRTGTVNPADLVNYLTSTNAGAMLESKHEIVQALNLIMGHYPKTDNSIISIGANKHYSINPSTMESRSLGGGLDVLRGFFISVRAATARVLLNVQVKYVACYQSGPLGMVIADWRQANRPNLFSLQNFLKTMRVRITHLERKSSSGKSKPRIKTIKSLATPSDGKGSDGPPPKVARFGAGPRDVQFFLSAKGPGSSETFPSSDGKGKKGKKTPPKAGPAPEGRYITVEQFFKQGKPSLSSVLTDANCSRAQHHSRSTNAGRQLWNPRKPGLLPRRSLRCAVWTALQAQDLASANLQHARICSDGPPASSERRVHRDQWREHAETGLAAESYSSKKTDNAFDYILN